MTNWIPPAAIFIFGACIIPFLTGKAKQVYLLLLPVLAFINLLNMPEGTDWVFNFLGYEVIFGKVVADGVAALKDIGSREILFLSILAIAVLGLGLWPNPLLEVMHVSVDHLLDQTAISKF